MGTDECFFEPTKAKPDDIVNWLRTETGKLSPIEYSGKTIPLVGWSGALVANWLGSLTGEKDKRFAIVAYLKSDDHDPVSVISFEIRQIYEGRIKVSAEYREDIPSLSERFSCLWQGMMKEFSPYTEIDTSLAQRAASRAPNNQRVEDCK